MPAKTSPKGALGKKIGPVPVKYLLVVVIAVGGYLLFRHFKGQTTTSAGTSSVPQSASLSPPAPSDSTGGGASGLGSGDLSNLLGLFGQQESALLANNTAFQSIAQTLSASPPTSTSTTTTYYYPSSGQKDTGGGNTSSGTGASGTTGTQPASSFPASSAVGKAAQEVASLVPAGGSGAPGSYTPATVTAVATPVSKSPTKTVDYAPGAPFATAKTATPPSGYSQKSGAHLH